MDALGENLGVALLPSGPAGPAQPLVQAEGFVLREGTTEASRNLALEFMRFATDLQSQTLLMNEANNTAANVTVSTAEDRAFAVFVEQAQAGFLQPNTPHWQPLVELGQAAYVDVLEEGLDPIAVVAELTQAINLANGIVVAEPTPTPSPPVEDEPIESEPVEREGDALPATVTPAAEPPIAETPEAEPKGETITTPTQDSPARRPGNSEP